MRLLIVSRPMEADRWATSFMASMSTRKPSPGRWMLSKMSSDPATPMFGWQASLILIPHLDS